MSLSVLIFTGSFLNLGSTDRGLGRAINVKRMFSPMNATTILTTDDKDIDVHHVNQFN